MAYWEKNFLVVVKDLEKTITADSHLACLLDVNTSAPGYDPHQDMIGENQTPVVKITYEDLDLSGIEAAYTADKGVLPLRNFLVGKKKGQDKGKCVFGLYFTGFNGGNHAIYYLQVDKNFKKKLDGRDWKPFSPLVGKIRICGLGEESVLLETGFRHSNGAFELKLEGEGNIDPFPVAIKTLQKLEKKIITFQFNVSLNCTAPGSPEWFGIKRTKGVAMSILGKMYDLPESSKDVTIVTASGAEVKAHKNILMAYCPVFYSMLNSENATTEAQTGRILMEENSEEGVTQLIRYFHGFRLFPESFSPDLVLEMFQLSHKYGVKELEIYMKDLLTDKGIEWYSVDCILELYFYVENNKDFEDLRAHALTEMSRLSQEALTESDFFKRLDSDKKANLRLTLWNWGRINF